MKSWHLEKTLMLGKIEGKRWRVQQRMRWLVSIANSMGINWSKLWEDRGAYCAAVHGVTKSRTQLSDWTTTYVFKYIHILSNIYVYIFENFHNFHKNSIKITFYYATFQVYTYTFSIHTHIYVLLWEFENSHNKKVYIYMCIYICIRTYIHIYLHKEKGVK